MKLASLAQATLCAGVLLASPAFAHTGSHIEGLASGMLHPITGLDHVVAMIAVGLWGGILGGAAVWKLPVVFPLVMVLAGVLGAYGIPLPGIEAGIAASGIVLGTVVMCMLRPKVSVAMALVALFAVFHGHAHGAELPAAAHPATYALGFVLATAALHGLGIVIGQLIRWPSGQMVVRAAGGAIALAGAAFLTGVA